MARQVPECEVHLRDLVFDVQREGSAVRPADVVRARQQQKSAGRLTGTCGVDVFDVQALSDDLGIADKIVCVVGIQRRTETERHRIAQCEVVMAFTRRRRRNRPQHEQGGS